MSASGSETNAEWIDVIIFIRLDRSLDTLYPSRPGSSSDSEQDLGQFNLSDGLLGGQPDEKELQNWALTLSAMNIPYRLSSRDSRPVLLVHVSQAEQAIKEIKLFLKENKAWRKPANNEETNNQEVEAFRGGKVTPLPFVLGALVLWFLGSPLSISKYYIDWKELGKTSALAIQQGEWWRAVTALTLHADAAHFLGNIALGGLILLFLAREIGTGLAFFVALASGFLGNLLNAFIHPSWHTSIGASTAVFGVVGALGMVLGLRGLRQGVQDKQKFFLSLACSLAFLGFFGSGGENIENVGKVDLAAHLLGFLSGLFLGAACSFLPCRDQKTQKFLDRLNCIAGTLTCLILITAWVLALKIPEKMFQSKLLFF